MKSIQGSPILSDATGFSKLVAGKLVLVAPPLTYIGKGFREDGSGNFHEVAFESAHGDCRGASIPHAMVSGDGRGALRVLSDAGYPVPRDDGVQEAILAWLMAEYAACQRIIIHRSATGWFEGGSFLLGSEEIRGSATGLRLMQSLTTAAGDYEVKGTLRGWQQQVTIPASQSKFMVLGILIAFAAPLARFAGVASGGFNISGAPGAGKTASLKVGAGVFGANPPWRTWDVSDQGPGTLAQSHNDLPLFMDELGALEKRGAAGADLLGKHIYRLSGSVARVTSHRAAAAPDHKVDTTTLFLSTSETPIPDFLRTARGQLPEGALTRLFDIPLDPASRSGVFDVPDFQSPGKQFDVTAREIWAATERHMGVAGREYLRRLLPTMQEHQASFLRWLEQQIGFWEAKSKPLFDASTDPRIIRRFALLYAAGCLAARWGIVPPEFARAQGPALQRCLSAGLQPTPGQSVGVALVERLRVALTAPGAVADRQEKAPNKHVLGYRRKTPAGMEMLLRKAPLADLFGVELDALLSELRKLGAIKLDTRGSNFHRHRVLGRKGELESILIINPDRVP